MMSENTQKMMNSLRTIMESSSMVRQKAETMFCSPIPKERQYFKIRDSTRYSMFCSRFLIVEFDSLFFFYRPLRYSASSSESVLSPRAIRCSRMEKVTQRRVMRKAQGNFYYYYSAYWWEPVEQASPKMVTLQWASGRQMRRGKNKKIMEAKGRRMSLSPVRMLAYPTRDAPMFSSTHTTKANPDKICYSILPALYNIYTRFQTALTPSHLYLIERQQPFHMGNDSCCAGGPVDQGLDFTTFKLTQPAAKVISEKRPFSHKISAKWDTIQYPDKLYQGDIQNQKPKGYGRMFRKDGSYHIGQFHDGSAQGDGFYVTADGEYYEGKFVDNKATDRNAKYVAGDVEYKGGFQDNGFTGQGTETSDRHIFKGTYKDGRRVRGVLQWKEHPKGQFEYRYEGQFDERNLFTGEATLQDPLGNYKGSFKRGLKEGKGRYQYKSRMAYEGEYRRGKKEGHGKIYNSDGSVSYQGQMLNDLPNGKGVMCTKSGEKFESEFIDGIQAKYVCKEDQEKIKKRQQREAEQSSHY